ncbi:hypothetical protein [Kitasatospora sp. LaBMicrA B282]|uniref:hypothetical protein n=1 Tax=Kitasatospora sp. LaBMicrA B282 TaxID=3420949 RepID=UPI003D105634
MATSERWLPGWLGSRAHFVGAGGAALGLVVSLVEGLGVTSVGVVGGLYAAGALLGVTFGPKDPKDPAGPKDPTDPAEGPDGPDGPAGPQGPDGPPAAEAPGELLAGQRARVAQAHWPQPGSTLADRLLERLAQWLAEAAPADPRPQLEQAVAALEHYERDLCWQRLEPGGRPPEEAFAERVAQLLAGLHP